MIWILESVNRSIDKENHNIYTYAYNTYLPKENKNEIMSSARKMVDIKKNKPNTDKYQNF